MRHFIVLSALAIALVSAGTANAGGWATVGLDPLPDGIDAGETWKTEITVLQHGRTPLDGLSPTLTINGPEASRTFTATPTGKTGVYEARAVFPETGSWSVVVESGFGESRLTYGPVTIGAAPGGSPGPLAPIAVLAAALALLAAGVLGVRRLRRHPMPASR